MAEAGVGTDSLANKNNGVLKTWFLIVANDAQKSA